MRRPSPQPSIPRPRSPLRYPVLSPNPPSPISNPLPSPGLQITRLRHDLDRESDARPLDFGLIRRLLSYTRPYAAKRNWLLLTVVVRAIQLPCVAWVIGAVINGPIAHAAPLSSVLAGAAGFLALALFTQFNFHFRQRLALELGEAVVHDLQQ